MVDKRVVVAAIVLLVIVSGVLMFKPWPTPTTKPTPTPPTGEVAAPSFSQDYEDMKTIWQSQGVKAEYLHHGYEELLQLPDEKLEAIKEGLAKFGKREDISVQALTLSYTYQDLIDLSMAAKQAKKLQTELEGRDICTTLMEHEQLYEALEDMVYLAGRYIESTNMFVEAWPEDANTIKIYSTPYSLDEQKMLLMEFGEVIDDLSSDCETALFTMKENRESNVAGPILSFSEENQEKKDEEEAPLDETEEFPYVTVDEEEPAVVFATYAGASKFAFIYGYPADAIKVPVTTEELTEMGKDFMLGTGLTLLMLVPGGGIFGWLGKLFKGVRYTLIGFAKAPVYVVSGAAKLFGKTKAAIMWTKNKLFKRLKIEDIMEKAKRWKTTFKASKKKTLSPLERLALEIRKGGEVLEKVAKISKKGKITTAAGKEAIKELKKQRTALKRALERIEKSLEKIREQQGWLKRVREKLRDRIEKRKYGDPVELAEAIKQEKDAAALQELFARYLEVAERKYYRLQAAERWLARTLEKKAKMAEKISEEGKKVLSQEMREAIKKAEKAAAKAKKFKKPKPPLIVRALNVMLTGTGAMVAGAFYAHNVFLPEFMRIPVTGGAPLKLTGAIIAPVVQVGDLMDAMNASPTSEEERNALKELKGKYGHIKEMVSTGFINEKDYLVSQRIIVNPYQGNGSSLTINYLGNVYSIHVKPTLVYAGTPTSTMRISPRRERSFVFEIYKLDKGEGKFKKFCSQSSAPVIIKPASIIGAHKGEFVRFSKCSNVGFFVRSVGGFSEWINVPRIPPTDISEIVLYDFILPEKEITYAKNAYESKIPTYIRDSINKLISEVAKEYWFYEINTHFYPVAEGALGRIGLEAFKLSGSDKERTLTIVEATPDNRLKILYIIRAHKTSWLHEKALAVYKFFMGGKYNRFFDYYKPKQTLYLDEMEGGKLYDYLKEAEITEKAGAKSPFLEKLKIEPIDESSLRHDNIAESMFYSIAFSSVDALGPKFRYPAPVRLDNGNLLVSEIPVAGPYISAIVIATDKKYSSKLNEAAQIEFANYEVAAAATDSLYGQSEGLLPEMFQSCGAEDTGITATARYGFDRLAYNWDFYGKFGEDYTFENIWDEKACVADFDGYNGKGMFCDATQHTISLLKNVAGYAYYLQRVVKNMPDEVKQNIPFDEINTVKELYRVTRKQTPLLAEDKTLLFFDDEHGLLEAPYDEEACPEGPDFSGVLNMIEEGAEFGAYNMALDEMKKCYSGFTIPDELGTSNLLAAFSGIKDNETIEVLEEIGAKKVGNTFYMPLTEYAKKHTEINQALAGSDVEVTIKVGMINKRLGDYGREYVASKAASWSKEEVGVENTYFLDMPVKELLIADSYGTTFKTFFTNYYKSTGDLKMLEELLLEGMLDPEIINLQSWKFTPEIVGSGLYKVEIEGTVKIEDPYNTAAIRLQNIEVKMTLDKTLEQLDTELGTSYAKNSLLKVAFDGPIGIKRYKVMIDGTESKLASVKLSELTEITTTESGTSMPIEINIRRKPMEIQDLVALRVVPLTRNSFVRLDITEAVPVFLALGTEGTLEKVYYGLSERLGKNELFDSLEDYGQGKNIFSWTNSGGVTIEDVVGSAGELREPCGLEDSVPVVMLDVSNNNEETNLFTTVAVMPRNSQLTLVCANSDVRVLASYYNNNGATVTKEAQLQADTLFGKGGNIVVIDNVRKPSLQQYLAEVREGRMCVEADGQELKLKWNTTLLASPQQPPMLAETGKKKAQ
jgi:hypothetical protein